MPAILPVNPVLRFELVEYAEERGLDLRELVDDAIEDYLEVVAAMEDFEQTMPGISVVQNPKSTSAATRSSNQTTNRSCRSRSRLGSGNNRGRR